VGAHLWVFLGISAVLIAVAGPDTALVTKNAMLRGRRGALGFGVSLAFERR
jgi:threonine/homoserine/homoserine lactone efflux protein